jgi:16S rRNA (cytosine967-C5)-methyltransferase
MPPNRRRSRARPDSSRRGSPAAAPAAAPHPPADARDCAIRRLAAQAARFPTLDIAPLDSAGLPPREQALAHAIYDAVLRRWLTLEAVLNTLLKRPLRAAEPPAQAALLAGAAQILLLDRIPEHAAIDESVRWIKRNHRPAAGGLVNGVLRSLTRALERGEDGAIARRQAFTGRRDEIPLPDGSAIGFTQPLLPEDEAALLSAHTSISPWLIKRWHEADPARARTRALHSLLHAPVTLNIAHTTAALESEFIQPHERPGSAIFTGPRSELEFLVRGRSDLWVQDAASAAPLGKLQMANGQKANPATGAGAGSGAAPSDLPFASLPFAISVIADLCAGSGTKTRQLAAIFPDAEIIASDPDEARAATLRSVFAASPNVRALEPAAAREALLGRADLILLDVPCSNTGVLGRRPEARYRASQAQFDRLAAIQRQIIADAIPLLKPGGGRRGGAILYSTCSLEPEENEQQAAWARKWHKCEVSEPLRLEPSGEPGASPTTYTDAAFAVLLTGLGG